jgi:hypothetical protein
MRDLREYSNHKCSCQWIYYQMEGQCRL